jgi:tripartite-type tricarboxylate transporter receptor subunit TctC
MRFPSRKFLNFAAVTLAVLCAMLSDHTVLAQTTRTIKIVVPFPPGGTADVLSRILAEQIGRNQRVTIVVENRAGAGAVIGTDMVSRAAPDGNTLLITAVNFVTTPHLRKVNYDPLLSFEPICQLTSTPVVLAVNSSSPYRSLADLVKAARANPGRTSIAALPASISQIAVEKFKRAAKLDVIFVPFPGDAPSLNALLGEHVTSIIGPYSGMAEQIRVGRVRPLAVASPVRVEPLPDVPTIAEAGYTNNELEFWNGLFVPAKTPITTVAQLATWFSTALQAEEVKQKLVAQGIFPVGTCGADFAALLSKQYEDFGRVIREANIKAE